MLNNRIIILILSITFLFSQVPSKYRIIDDFGQERSTSNGWPGRAVIDLRGGLDNNIFSGTGDGLGKINSNSFENLEELHQSLFEVNDQNLPSGGNPSLKSYDLDSGEKLFIISGVISVEFLGDDEPSGTGIAWSEDSGYSWKYIDQPTDAVNGNITADWYGTEYEHLSITTEVQNVSYDVAADTELEYIYAASWGGMLRRFKYTDSNPIWQSVPLPMDDQDNLSCSLEECDNQGENCSDDEYFYTPQNPPIGHDNHKPFSVHVEGDIIWVGTADGINKGEIAPSGCIDWIHYNKENTNFSLGGNWVIGIHAQYLEDDTRIWAISWDGDNTTPHYLSYTDDNGTTWNKDNGLRQGIGAVTYNLFSINDSGILFENRLYAATTKGLFEKDIIIGCMDPAASNYDPDQDITENNGCEYIDLDITNGCELEENYFYLNPLGLNEYEVLYNSSHEITGFNFDVNGANITDAFGGEAADFLSINYNGNNIDASTFTGLEPGCGHLITLELDGEPQGLSSIQVNGNICFNYYSLELECLEENEWSKIEIPNWIFDEIGIDNEQDSDFKVYSMIRSGDLDRYLWIGTTDGLIVSDILTGNFYYPSYITDIITNSLEAMLVYPNPFLIDAPGYRDVKFQVLSANAYNGKIDIYDFSMTKIFDDECYNDGEYINCKWNGLSNNGNRVANGIYFCKVQTGGKTYWEKLGLVKFK